jgi:hypothetical protein
VESVTRWQTFSPLILILSYLAGIQRPYSGRIRKDTHDVFAADRSFARGQV